MAKEGTACQPHRSLRDRVEAKKVLVCSTGATEKNIDTVTDSWYIRATGMRSDHSSKPGAGVLDRIDNRMRCAYLLVLGLKKREEGQLTTS